MKPILVFGRQGQVARELAELADGRAMVFLGREEFDLATHSDIDSVLRQIRPAAVINAAAFTAVDRAESDQDLCFRLNRDAPKAMALACAAHEIPFTHISTDYVFDGEKAEPYGEHDPKNPRSVYGASKSQGEFAIASAGGCYAILRTAWVFSSYGSNFLKTMLNLAQTQPKLRIVHDQLGRPTWARDVALAALAATTVMENTGEGLGVIHAAGDDDATWADFAAMIFDQARQRGRPFSTIQPIETKDYPTPAQRPRNSRLATDKAKAILGWRATPLPHAIGAVLDQLTPTP
jgi:dTDP-4-dehydrorhamnose reductase